MKVIATRDATSRQEIIAIQDATSPQELIERAMQLFMENRLRASNELLLSVAQNADADPLVSFYIGRNYVYLQENIEAEKWLKLALSLDQPFEWTYYELSWLYDSQGRFSDAVKLMTQFLNTIKALGVRPEFNETHRTIILDIGHRGFNVERAAAVNLYKEVLPTGTSDYLSLLRIAEDIIDGGDLIAASDAMAQVQANYELDAWGLFALARLLKLQGREDEAVRKVQEAIKLQPENVAIRIKAIHRMIDLGRLREADDLLTNLNSETTLKGTPKSDILGVQFRLNTFNRNLESLIADFIETASL